MARPHARRFARTLRYLLRNDVTTVVSTMTESEAARYHLTEEWRECRAAGLEFFWWPIPEHGVPNDTDAVEFLPTLRDRLLAGQHVVIHCRLALGRSPMVAAALLTELGVAPEVAWHAVSAARGRRVPTRASQRAWVKRWAAQAAGATAAIG